MSFLPPSRNLVLPLSFSDAFSYIIHTQKKKKKKRIGVSRKF